jgi:DNA adenine methylase
MALMEHESDQDPKVASKGARPFLRWPGGKRWFTYHYLHLIPAGHRLIEPFLGSGSVFFRIAPKRSLLSDCNEDLIACFKALKKDWKPVLGLLKRHHKLHSHDYYYEMRASKPTSSAGRAAKFIYLNRTCFNGIYRVNASGEFNTPVGSSKNVVLPEDDFEAVSAALENASIKACDFEDSIDDASKGDVVFADPPYTVRHNTNAFIEYNESLFSWYDQQRLALALRRAKSRGAQVVLTNANHPSVRELYADHFRLHPVSRFSSIAADPKNRSRFTELVITN